MPRWWEPPAIAVLVAVAITAVPVGPVTIALVALAAVTPALTVVDALEHRLPNRMVLPLYLAGLAALAAEWSQRGVPPWVALVSGFATAAFLGLLGIRGGMGMGDVKLGGALGLASGLLGVTAAMLAPLVAFLLGGGAAVLVLARRDGGRAVPFGPFLLGGFWVAVLVAGVL